ncbi:MAG: PDZ domain-containing protein [Anaerolineales bacterium]|nr:PDZ domain-containing protein [Anaerolineales bacterium]
MSSNQRNLGITAVIFLAFVLLCWGSVFLATNVADQFWGEPTPTPFVDDGYPGVLITKVIAGSPGERGGLQPGYLIVEADGRIINTPDELLTIIARKESGDAIQIIVEANGERRQTEVYRGLEPPYLGIEVIENNPNARIHLPLPTVPQDGEIAETTVPPTIDPAQIGLAVVTKVLPDTPAAGVGLEVGDVITAVDGNAVLSTVELVNLLSGKAAGDTITLTLRRGPDTLTQTVTLAPHPDDATRGFLGIELQSP